MEYNFEKYEPLLVQISEETEEEADGDNDGVYKEQNDGEDTTAIVEENFNLKLIENSEECNEEGNFDGWEIGKKYDDEGKQTLAHPAELGPTEGNSTNKFNPTLSHMGETCESEDTEDSNEAYKNYSDPWEEDFVPAVPLEWEEYNREKYKRMLVQIGEETEEEDDGESDAVYNPFYNDGENGSVPMEKSKPKHEPILSDINNEHEEEDEAEKCDENHNIDVEFGLIEESLTKFNPILNQIGEECEAEDGAEDYIEVDKCHNDPWEEEFVPVVALGVVEEYLEKYMPMLVHIDEETEEDYETELGLAEENQIGENCENEGDVGSHDIGISEKDKGENKFAAVVELGLEENSKQFNPMLSQRGEECESEDAEDNSDVYKKHNHPWDEIEDNLEKYWPVLVQIDEEIEEEDEAGNYIVDKSHSIECEDTMVQIGKLDDVNKDSNNEVENVVLSQVELGLVESKSNKFNPVLSEIGEECEEEGDINNHQVGNNSNNEGEHKIVPAVELGLIEENCKNFNPMSSQIGEECELENAEDNNGVDEQHNETWDEESVPLVDSGPVEYNLGKYKSTLVQIGEEETEVQDEAVHHLVEQDYNSERENTTISLIELGLVEESRPTYRPVLNEIGEQCEEEDEVENHSINKDCGNEMEKAIVSEVELRLVEAKSNKFDPMWRQIGEECEEECDRDNCEIDKNENELGLVEAKSKLFDLMLSERGEECEEEGDANNDEIGENQNDKGEHKLVPAVEMGLVEGNSSGIFESNKDESKVDIENEAEEGLDLGSVSRRILRLEEENMQCDSSALSTEELEKSSTPTGGGREHRKQAGSEIQPKHNGGASSTDCLNPNAVLVSEQSTRELSKTSGLLHGAERVITKGNIKDEKGFGDAKKKGGMFFGVIWRWVRRKLLIKFSVPKLLLTGEFAKESSEMRDTTARSTKCNNDANPHNERYDGLWIFRLLRRKSN